MCHSKMERDEFLSKVEQTINVEIFGKMEFNKLRQWRVPLEGQVIGKVKLLCMDANKLIDKLVLIVEVCAEKLSADKQEDWKNCTELYASTMHKLKSRKVFTFKDVCDFQLSADRFMEV